VYLVVFTYNISLCSCAVPLTVFITCWIFAVLDSCFSCTALVYCAFYLLLQFFVSLLLWIIEYWMAISVH